MSRGMYDLLADIADRCNVNSEKILRKTKELITLLNSKQLVNCSDTCKVVVCLELASSLSSSPLSREEAIKYSGCKKKNYNNFYNNISKLLNLDKVYSVAEICLLIGLTDVTEPAKKLLKKYISKFKECDFEHPMYSCAAILAFCRTNKIKINLPKLVEISRIKKLELEELTRKFSMQLESEKKNEKIEKKKINKPFIREPIETAGNETPRKKMRTTGIMSDEEYEEWKRKMLED